MPMDSCDLAIIEILKKDSAMSLSDVGKMLGISRFVVKERIEKLFRDKVILGPTVVLNPPLVGLRRTVFFEFKTNPHEPWLAKLLEEMKSCDMLDGITGEYSLLGRFRIGTEQHFGQMLKTIDKAMSKSFFKRYRVVNVIRTFKESDVPFDAKAGALSLDSIDLEILRTLLDQTKYVRTPRPLSTTQISTILRDHGVQISQPAVFRRLIRLENEGIILRHAVVVDHAKIGIKAKLIVRIKVNPGSYDTVAQDFLTPMNEITDLYRTGEDYGLLAIARVVDISHYDSLLRKLYGSEDIMDTYTVLVLEERKKSPLPLDEDYWRKEVE